MLVQLPCNGPTPLHKSRPRDVGLSLTPELEVRIVQWVNRLRGEGVPISTLMFQLQALEVANEAGLSTFKASTAWQRRFRKRHRLSMRTRTRQGQIRPEDADAQAAAFAAKVHAKMAELGVTVVYNADQTAVFFLISPKENNGADRQQNRLGALCRQGQAAVHRDAAGRFEWSEIRTNRGAENAAVQTAPRAQRFGRHLWKRIKPIEDSTGLKIHTNAAGWWNEFLHRDFLQTHFGSRDDMTVPILLLLDEFSGHWTKETKAFAASINVHLMAVPPGLTSVCQPADVSWMRPFKDYMRGEWISFLRGQGNRLVPGARFKMKAPRYEEVYEWVRTAWDKMAQSTIQAGYVRTGISVHANDVIEHLEIDGDIGEISEEAEFDN